MLDDGVLAGIVEAARVQPGDLVLEIGPGTLEIGARLACGACVCERCASVASFGGGRGAAAPPALLRMRPCPRARTHRAAPAARAGTGNLTRHLLGAGALVTAVEKDFALSEQLAAEFEGVSA